jgi:predicted GNAT family acetyltransferase
MSDRAAGPEVDHEEESSRFAVHLGGHLAVLEYQLFSDKIVFTHTEVAQELEGRGVGASLARAGLEWARSRELRVVPVCPFVAAYIGRHPEYVDLVRRRPTGA